MAPQASIPAAATVLGTIGTILWCVQLVPQIWTNWRAKATDGLPGSMMLLWALCGVPFGTYAVVQHFSLPLRVQPQVFAALCLASWAQTLAYSRRWRARAAALLGAAVAAALAGAEAALVLTIRPVYDAGDETPVLVVGVAASVLLAAGLLPPYGEMWKRRGRVIGINWVRGWARPCMSLTSLRFPVIAEVLTGWRGRSSSRWTGTAPSSRSWLSVRRQMPLRYASRSSSACVYSVVAGAPGLTPASQSPRRNSTSWVAFCT